MRPADVDAELAERVANGFLSRLDLGDASPSEVRYMQAVLAAVLPEIQAQALRDHRRRVARFMPAGMVDRATVLADLDDYAARLAATTEEPK